MTEPEGGPVPSLIQQRMALSRRRSYVVYTIVTSAVLATAWLTMLIVDGNELWRWIGAVVFAASVVYGVIEFRRVRRDTRAFEAQHGARAGQQKPIR